MFSRKYFKDEEGREEGRELIHIPKQQDKSYSIKVVIRKDGREVVRKIGKENPTTCKHHFIEFTDKRSIRRQRCPKCGLTRKVLEKEGGIGWTYIPQETLKEIMRLAEEIEDWDSLRLEDVHRFLGRSRSRAKGYYYTLVSIQSLKRGEEKAFSIQQKTLRKLVTLFKAFNGRDFTWQDIKSLLKRKFGKCSRPTAKRFETVIRHLNAKIPTPRAQGLGIA